MSASIESLPIDIFGHILSYTTHQEQFELRLICKKWNKIISTGKFYQQSNSFIEMCINNKFMSFNKYINDPALMADNETEKYSPGISVCCALSTGYSICVKNNYRRLANLIKIKYEYAHYYYLFSSEIRYCFVKLDRELFNYLLETDNVLELIQNFISNFSNDNMNIHKYLPSLITLTPKTIIEEVLKFAITKNYDIVVQFLTSNGFGQV